MDMMKTLQEWAMPGALLGVGAVLLTKIVSQFIGPVTLKLATPALEFDVRSRILAGLPTSAGEKIFAFFQGYLPLSASVWIIAAISGIAIAVVGRMLYDVIPFKGNTQTQKVALILLYGTILLGLVFGSMTASLNIEMGQMIITMLIYYGILAWAMGMVFKQMNISVPN